MRSLLCVCLYVLYVWGSMSACSYIRVPVTLQQLTGCQSVRHGGRRAPFGAHDQKFICSQTIMGLVYIGHPDEKTGKCNGKLVPMLN
jgi:hypothetical protein